MDAEASSTEGRTWFQWGGTICVIILLIVNRVTRSSSIKTSLLVIYLLSSLPEIVFKIVRGGFGCWVAFLAVAAHLFFPRDFPESRFILLVVTPSCVANELHGTILGGIVCLVIGVLLIIEECRGPRGYEDWRVRRCLLTAMVYMFLIFFNILYLCKGPW